MGVWTVEVSIEFSELSTSVDGYRVLRIVPFFRDGVLLF